MNYLKLLLPLVLAVMLGCTETNPVGVETEPAYDASQPVPLSKTPFRAELDLLVNPGAFVDPTAPTWTGDVVTDGATYGIVFYSLGSGKSYPNPIRGASWHFEEIYEIYTWVDLNVETQTLTTGDLLVRGRHQGVLSLSTSTVHAEGTILEAYGEMSMWQDRHEQMSGPVAFTPEGVPFSSSIVMRLN